MRTHQIITTLALCLALAGCGAAPPRLPQGGQFAAPTQAPAPTPPAVDLGALPVDAPGSLLSGAVGVPFELALGEELAVGGTGLSVIFTAVAEDSRCPEDARCLWAGRAVVTVEVLAAGQEVQSLSLAIPGDITPDAPAEHALGGYTLRMVDLAPYPSTSGGDGAPYVVTLVLEGP